MFNHFFNSLLRVFWEKNTFSINFSKKKFLTRVYVQYKKYNKVCILLYMVQYKGHFYAPIHLIIKHLTFYHSPRWEVWHPRFSEMGAKTLRDRRVLNTHSPRWVVYIKLMVSYYTILPLLLHSKGHQNTTNMAQACIIYDVSNHHI